MPGAPPECQFHVRFSRAKIPQSLQTTKHNYPTFRSTKCWIYKKREISVRKSSSIGWHWQSQRGQRQVYRHPALDNRCLSELQSRRLWTPIQKAQDCNPKGSGLQFGHRETGVSPYQYCSTYKEVLDTRYSEVIICFDYLIAAEIDYFHCHL